VSIRDAVPADVAALAAIYDHYVRTSVGTFDVEEVGTQVLAAKIESIGGSDHVIVADVDGVMLGFAYSGPFRPRPAYAATKEVSVYLAAGARGRGLGRALYSELLRRLDSDPAVHTQMAVIALPNTASEALHLASGFRHLGTLEAVGHKFGRWVDTAYYQRISRDGPRL